MELDEKWFKEKWNDFVGISAIKKEVEKINKEELEEIQRRESHRRIKSNPIILKSLSRKNILSKKERQVYKQHKKAYYMEVLERTDEIKKDIKEKRALLVKQKKDRQRKELKTQMFLDSLEHSKEIMSSTSKFMRR
jgi:hypothetical protein